MYEYEAIEKKRKEMFDIAGRYGFASEKTIRCSPGIRSVVECFNATPNYVTSGLREIEGGSFFFLCGLNEEEIV